MACLLSSPCVVSSLSSSDWPRNIEDIFLFFPLFILSFFFFFPLRQREHHSLFSRSEREQLSVGGARSRWQVMNGQAGCKWQYADKPDHLQMDVGRWRVCGVGWWMEASEVRGRKKAECVCGWGGFNPSWIIFLAKKRRWRWKHLPSREPHLLELMEACRKHTAGGNTLRVTSTHHCVDHYPQSILARSKIGNKKNNHRTWKCHLVLCFR